jgi:hypothetical protein
LAAGSLAAMAMTGCTATEAGVATPGTIASTTSATSAAAPTPDVPRVSDPLDASRYIADPCAVLTQAQLASHGVSRTGRPDTTSTSAEYAGPKCSWFGQEADIVLSVIWQTTNKNGLADTYFLQEDYDSWDHFEATEVDGYPAVFNNLSGDAEHGTCGLVTGVSDTLTFYVLIQGQSTISGEESCSRVMQVATAVIQMLKENP